MEEYGLLGDLVHATVVRIASKGIQKQVLVSKLFKFANQNFIRKRLIILNGLLEIMLPFAINLLEE